MPIYFSTILHSAGIDPHTAQVVRHQDTKADRLKTPYALWRKDRQALELYQSIQRKHVFRRRNLAIFVATPFGETLFVGLYEVRGRDTAPDGMIDPVHGHSVAGFHLYDLENNGLLSEFEGKLCVDWGKGYLSWAQRAEIEKRVVEIRREVVDPPFPGYLKLITRLSEVRDLPIPWIERLQEARGIYLLTCPRTKEQYVGSATGVAGFFGRWLQHAANGGAAIGLQSRDPSDYQVSIIEVAGSGMSDHDVVIAEQLWMQKLQSAAMGLNVRRGLHPPSSVPTTSA